MFIKNPDSMQTYITQGLTFMRTVSKPKTQLSNELILVYKQSKLLTSCIAALINKNVTRNNTLANDQNKNS